MSHTYSRTHALLTEFGRCFGSADSIVLHRIYASARETNEGGVSGQDLYREVSKNHRNVIYIEQPVDAVAPLAAELKPGDSFHNHGRGGQLEDRAGAAAAPRRRAMTSMTGFGHGEHRDSRVQMVLEVRSYNNRYLELSINLPYSIKQLEPRVREYLSSRIQRGKVEFYLSLTELEDSSDVVVDHARVRTYTAALEELRRRVGDSRAGVPGAPDRAGRCSQDGEPGRTPRRCGPW